MDSKQLNKYSEELLLNVKMKKDTLFLQQKLKNINSNFLQEALTNDDQKKAFWINIYNAYYLILRTQEGFTKPDIYKKKLFTIANNKLSLDDVEHGILRRFKYKYSFGFLPNLFTSKFVKTNAVAILDYRIHFALNCGAKSCPPIAFYNAEKINKQLDLATQSFLEGETIFDNTSKIVNTTALFKWYYGDFNGEKGIKEIYSTQLNKDITDYQLKYNEYSWEDDLNNFA